MLAIDKAKYANNEMAPAETKETKTLSSKAKEEGKIIQQVRGYAV